MGKYQTYTCTSIICNVQSTFQWSLVVDEEYFKYISERAQYFSVSWSLFCEMQNKLIWVFWKIRNCLFQFCIRRPTSFFYRRKRSALFWCPGRIEIMYLFSWLLQNNRLGLSISNNISPPRRVFCNKEDNACFKGRNNRKRKYKSPLSIPYILLNCF